VLTGRAESGGRLPITFPVDEDNTPIQSPEQYLGVDGIAEYSQELRHFVLARCGERPKLRCCWLR
jgi:hypothetical protein